jgi:hypothetical protein
MRRLLIRIVAATLALNWPAAIRGADELTPLSGPTLPMPAPASPVPLPPPGSVSFILPNRMAVWQNYAVDRAGRWRPRVALTGNGAYYTINGKPYWYLPVNQLNVMPYLFD